MNLIAYHLFQIAVFNLSVMAFGSPLNQERTVLITDDGQHLSAMWTVPQPVKGAALLIQGSGNVGFDGDVSGPFTGTGYRGQDTKLSAQIAEKLATKGIASLRYSKRGVDDSAQRPNQTAPLLVSDASAALRATKNRFSNIPIFIIGFSEGALVGAIVNQMYPVNSLHLLSLPTRAVDELLAYQFITWPAALFQQQMVSRHLENPVDIERLLSLEVTKAPGTAAAWTTVDFNQDQKIDFLRELIPFYQSYFDQIKGILETPDFSNWYHSFKELPALSSIFSKLKAKSVFIYQALDDAQVHWSWIFESLSYFNQQPTVRLFDGVGHCFSPMEGLFGEIKTSGPLSEALLDSLVNDISKSIP